VRRILGTGALLLLLVGCDAKPVLGPDGVELVTRLISDLGFYINAGQDYREAGYEVTPPHEDLADTWWRRLMVRLQGAGFSRADPEDIHHNVSITLRLPRGEHEYIYCKGMSGLVGACYHVGTSTLEVPGNYPTSTITERPRSQPFLHEALHHYCHKVYRHGCTTGNEHFWPARNDPNKNIWVFPWEDMGTAQLHQEYLPEYHGVYTPMDGAMYQRAYSQREDG